MAHAARAALAAGLACAALARAAPAAAAPDGPADERLGLAHVDVMELHLERQPGGPPLARERLSAVELAERYARARESGARWHRWTLYWDLVEHEGKLLWAAADGIAGRDVAAGLRPLVVLQGPPDQASRLPFVPKDLDRPIFRHADGSLGDDPAGAVEVNPENPWGRFVAAAVARYRPGGELAAALRWPAGAGVRAWEIGNEPNLGSFWGGSPADFARFLEVAYLVVEWLDPAAVVAHGGIADDANAAWWYGGFLDALKARAAVSPLPARYGHYFDRAAWHWYAHPRRLHTPPARARAILAERGLPPKPLWVTEVGLPIWSEHPGPCWDPASPRRVSVVEQSAAVWQVLAAALAEGAELVVWFQLYDDCGNGPASYDALGLVRNQASNQCWTPPSRGDCWRAEPALAGTPRPAFEAFRVAARELAGFAPLPGADAVPPGGGWQRVTLGRPTGERLVVAWNWSAADLPVSLEAAGEATVMTVGADGLPASRPVVPEAGRVTLTLPGATNRNDPVTSGGPLVAGRPAMLRVRPSDHEAPSVAMGALPERSPEAFTLEVLASDPVSGLGAYRVYVARSFPPARAEDWAPLGPATPWPGTPGAGRVTLPFRGEPGTRYFFAAHARDQAGNWSALPPVPLAWTIVAAGAPGGDAAPERVPGSRPSRVSAGLVG